MPSVNVGTKRRNDRSRRRQRSDTLPVLSPSIESAPLSPPASPLEPTVSTGDQAALHLASLVDVQARPLFSQIYERGRGDVGAFASDFLGVQLHEGQLRWMHTHPFATERHLASGNRWGKTIAGSVKLLHNAFYQIRPPRYAEMINDYIAINISLTVDMARIAFDDAMRFALDSKLFERFVVQAETKSTPFPAMVIGTPEFHRGGFRSQIWARSSNKDAKYLLGKKFDLINYDEAARDPRGNKILDEVLRMRLADRDGRLDMMSTAAGKNWFWVEFQKGLSTELDPYHLTYYSQTGSTYENPNVSHERLRRNESMMAKQWVEQNIYGGFADYANVFNRMDIEACYRDMDYHVCASLEELDTYPVNPEATYLMAVDWAVTRDETVVLVANVTDPQQASIVCGVGLGWKEDGSRWTWEEQKNAVVRIHQRFNYARALMDSTGMAGKILMQEMGTIGMRGHEGYDFGGAAKSKEQLILVAQQALQGRVVRWPFVPALVPLYDQLTLYDRNDKGLSTDWVFAFCLLCENLRRANLPVSELLDIPFAWQRLSRASSLESAWKLREETLFMPVSPAPLMEPVEEMPSTYFSGEKRVLTSTGWKPGE